MTTFHLNQLVNALDRITALERANKRLQARVAKVEKRPAQVKVVEYRNGGTENLC